MLRQVVGARSAVRAWSMFVHGWWVGPCRSRAPRRGYLAPTPKCKPALFKFDSPSSSKPCITAEPHLSKSLYIAVHCQMNCAPSRLAIGYCVVSTNSICGNFSFQWNLDCLTTSISRVMIWLWFVIIFLWCKCVWAKYKPEEKQKVLTYLPTVFDNEVRYRLLNSKSS